MPSLPYVTEARTRFKFPPEVKVQSKCFPRCSWFGFKGRAKARYWQELGVVEVISRSRPRYRSFAWDLDVGVQPVYGTKALRYRCGSKKDGRCLHASMQLRRNGVLYAVDVYGIRQDDFCEVAKFYAEKRRTEFDAGECDVLVSTRS